MVDSGVGLENCCKAPRCWRSTLMVCGQLVPALHGFAGRCCAPHPRVPLRLSAPDPCAPFPLPMRFSFSSVTPCLSTLLHSSESFQRLVRFQASPRHPCRVRGSPSSQSSPSHLRSLSTASSDSLVERFKSVSSMRRMNWPPVDLEVGEGR